MLGILAPQFQSVEAARKHLEKTLWPEGPICPHCGIINEAYLMKGESTRDGLYKCSACRQPFTVTIGTIFEDSKIPLHKWLLAIHLMCSSKKGISAHQLWRNLWGVNEDTGKPNGSYRSAWFMAHRIRWALGQEPVKTKLSGIVEIDETYVGGKFRHVGSYTPKRGERPVDRPSPTVNKAPVLSILQRDGEVRSMHMPRVTADTLRPIIDAMVDKSAHMMTDSGSALRGGPMGYKQSKGKPLDRGIRSPRGRRCNHDEHGRRLLLNPEARELRRLSSLGSEVHGSVFTRVRLPVQRPQAER